MNPGMSTCEAEDNAHSWRTGCHGAGDYWVMMDGWLGAKPRTPDSFSPQKLSADDYIQGVVELYPA